MIFKDDFSKIIFEHLNRLIKFKFNFKNISLFFYMNYSKINLNPTMLKHVFLVVRIIYRESINRSMVENFAHAREINAGTLFSFIWYIET